STGSTCYLPSASATVDQHGVDAAPRQRVRQADACHAAADDQDAAVRSGSSRAPHPGGSSGGRTAISICGLPAGGPGALLTSSPAAVRARRTAPLTLNVTMVPPGSNR